ncbi:MAG: hypothetical protein M1834_001381 [Cirrosporium novae-zelandiae]|nr:MAG: hypothetical protein M1834_001381 [Cirrosporium novae-zelandiae]
MPRAKRTVSETNPTSSNPAPSVPAPKTRKVSGGESSSNTNNSLPETLQPEWVTNEKHANGIQDEEEDDEYEPKEVIVISDEEPGCGKRECICRQPANLHPDHPWVISREGLQVLKSLNQALIARDSNYAGVILYNDYDAYESCEVVENAITAIKRQVAKKPQDPKAVWAQTKGLAIFLHGGVCDVWWMGSEGPQYANTVNLIGRGLLAGLPIIFDTPKGQSMLSENPAIVRKNIGLIMALYIIFGRNWDEMGSQDKETQWMRNVVRVAKKHNIEIKGPHGVEKGVEELLEMDREEGEEDDATDSSSEEFLPEWKKPLEQLKSMYPNTVSTAPKGRNPQRMFLDTFKAYASAYGQGGKIGGKRYDLSNMSKSEREYYNNRGGVFA